VGIKAKLFGDAGEVFAHLENSAAMVVEIVGMGLTKMVA